MNIIYIDNSSLLALALVVIGVPFFVIVSFEVIITKSTPSSFSYIILVTMVVLAFGVYLSTVKSHLTIDDNSLSLNHIIYTKKIINNEISEINYYKVIPDDLSPKIRINGISFGNIRIGRYRLKNKSQAFLMYSGSPVTVIKTSDDLVIFTSSNMIHNKILNWYEKAK